MEPSKKLWILLGGVPLLVLVLIAGYTMLGGGLEAPRAYLTDEGVAFDTAFLSEPIPINSLYLSEARIVSPGMDSEFRINRKDNGIAISEYRVGWFRLSSGERVFVALDSESSPLYIPTSSGFSLLIDGDSGMKLLSTLKETGDDA